MGPPERSTDWWASSVYAFPISSLRPTTIIGSIRAGLVFKLKAKVGPPRIRELEHDFIGRAIAAWELNANIDVLENHEADRLSIVSFIVNSDDKVLHHNYVVALLNDLFGIQARGGCSCAGPYGHRLLGIDRETSALFEDVIAGGCEVIKPGWVRLNSTTSSPKRSFSTSSMPSTWSLVMDGDYCPSIPMRPKPVCGDTATGYPNLRQVCTTLASQKRLSVRPLHQSRPWAITSTKQNGYSARLPSTTAEAHCSPPLLKNFAGFPRRPR